MEAITGDYININGLRMYYLDHGEGPPLILIHGGTGTARLNWEKHIPILSKHFRIIAPCSRGHGRTNNPPGEFSYQLMAEDVVELILELDLKKPLICGWSDGGQITLEIGIRYPDVAQALVVGGTLFKTTEQYEQLLRSWGIKEPGIVNFELVEKALPEFMAVWSELHALVYGPDYWKELLVNISKMWLNSSRFPQQNIQKINRPVLIVLGDRDEAISVEHVVEMYHMIPNAQLAIVPNSNHSLSTARVELFSQILLEFCLSQRNNASS